MVNCGPCSGAKFPSLDCARIRGPRAASAALERASVGTTSGRSTSYQYSLGRSYRGWPAHVPQLYWRDKYEDQFGWFFRPLGVSEPTGRAAVSVALLELVLSIPRAQIGALISINERSIRGGISAALQWVRADDHAVAFEDLLTAAAVELGRSEARVDYQVRRSQLAGFTNISEADWRDICKRAGVHIGRKNVRSAHAAAWLWAELMQQDVRDSPALKALVRNAQQDYGIQQKFVREQVPTMIGALLEYGKALLHPQSCG